MATHWDSDIMVYCDIHTNYANLVDYLGIWQYLSEQLVRRVCSRDPIPLGTASFWLYLGQISVITIAARQLLSVSVHASY